MPIVFGSASQPRQAADYTAFKGTETAVHLWMDADFCWAALGFLTWVSMNWKTQLFRTSVSPKNTGLTRSETRVSELKIEWFVLKCANCQCSMLFPVCQSQSRTDNCCFTSLLLVWWWQTLWLLSFRQQWHLLTYLLTFAVPRSWTTTYGQRSFSVSGPSLWNSLPLSARDPSLTITQFCTHLKTFLFRRAYCT